MEKLIIKIENDIKVNERCLQEKELPDYAIALLKFWIQYDNELLEIIRRLNK